MTDAEKEAFRDDVLKRMRAKQRTISEGQNPHFYVMECVEAMFNAAADVLVEIKSEASKGDKLAD